MRGEVCVANIGRTQRRLRLAFGLFMGGVTLMWLGAGLLLPLPRLLALGIFVPAFLAAVGVLQHTEST